MGPGTKWSIDRWGSVFRAERRSAQASAHPLSQAQGVLTVTRRQNVYACARLSISGLFFSHTFQSKSPARFILCAACGSVVLLDAARVF